MGNVMGKQKFSCTGVLRSTGQRVAVTVSADNRESAIQIADKHGVAVENVMPMAEAAPAPPKVAGPAQPKVVAAPAPPKVAPAQPIKAVEQKIVEKKVDGKKLDARIDDILSAEDDDLAGGLDDLDLGDDLDAAASPSSPTTKACPYCGEQILAVAVKCKHCGSYVGQKAAKTQPRQPDNDDAPSRGVPKRVWAIVVAAVAVVVIVPVAIFVAWSMFRSQPAPPVVPIPEPVAVSPPAAPVTPPPAPTPPAYKPSPEEVAFAGKLTTFLDGCDELAKLLEKVPKMDQFNKQCETIKSRLAAIPPAPQGLSWASEAVTASKGMLDVLNATMLELTTLDVAMESLHQTMKDSPEARQGCREAAERLRKPVADIRKLIPPACLAKPK
jgi:hypothetical protein